ncbi:MAG: GNAT family N-acetyltransferase [Candidatus Thermoplasmatota archaeon]|nr:GNAT family N-acetyltransferase [Candidatus Thermoplasmatota archaeon]
MGMETLRRKYPKKFATNLERVFEHIHGGDKIFIGTGCGKPSYLVKELADYVENNPKAFADAEIFHVWTLGVAPYVKPKFEMNFRHNAFFIGDNTRGAVNKGLADYTPIFLSAVPDLFHRDVIPVDVALIQLSTPDEHGYMSYGISVDIVKSAVENADVVIAQVNENMPRVLGESFIHIEDVDYVIPYDEPLLEYETGEVDETTDAIGKNVARLVEDGATIQVGYGSIPDAIVASLENKQDLGVHTELLTDGVVELMKKGIVTNEQKSIHRGKAIASFCMGHRDTYAYLNNNPELEFRPIEYTNKPTVIAQNHKMTAINTALEIDLTGQVTAESLGHEFYSGIGGQADFMRGAALSDGGKNIIALPSTAKNGDVSRIVPFLKEGAGVTLTRGDVHYVVTEYGSAYLHGKNIRERAVALISIAHPRFREQLLEEAKKYNLVYQDQMMVTGQGGIYPVDLEKYVHLPDGARVLLRPIKPADEELLKDLFYNLSNETIYKRFMGVKHYLPRQQLHELANVDYSKNMAIVAVIGEEEKEELVGVGRWGLDEDTNSAEVAFVVRDDWQQQGVGTELLKYLTQIAKRRGLYGFTADVLVNNRGMLRLFEKMDFTMEKELKDGVYHIRMHFD